MKLDLSIRERMAIGFGLIILLVALLLGLVVIKLEQLEREKDYLIHVVAERVEEAHNIESAFLNESMALHSYIATHDVKYLKTYQQERLTRLAATERLQKLLNTELGNDLFQQIKAYSQAFEALAGQLIDELQDGGGLPDREAREQRLRTLRTQVTGASRNYYHLQGRLRQDAAATYDRIHAALISNIFLLAGTILLICIAAAAVTIHSIRRPARELLGAIDALEHGDAEPARSLAASAAIGHGKPRNEMLALAATFGCMAEVIRAREGRLDAEGRVARAMGSTLDLEGLAAASLREVLAYASCDCGAVYQAGRRDQKLRLLAHKGLESPPGSLPEDDPIAGRAVSERLTVTTDEPPPDAPWRMGAAAGGRPLAWMLATPALFQGEPLGVLLIGGAHHGCEDIQEFCERIAHYLGTTMSNALTHQATLRLSEELRSKSGQLEVQNALLLEQRAQLQAQSELLQVQNEEIQLQSKEIQAQNVEIQSQNEELQQALNNLQESERELRSKTEALTEADRRKNEFLAMLAHELRNPLAAISNANYVLEQGSRSEEQAARLRQVVTRQVRHLSRMVDDLLDVSRITQGKVALRREPVDLEQAIRRAIDANQAQFAPRPLELQVEPPPGPVTVEADPVRLEQMIGALLNNAVKFSEPGDPIRLAAELDGGWVTLRVRDQGAGIAPEVLPHVFDLFTQAESGPDRAKGGLGIGLTMVKRLAELHGGVVEARSDGPGRGSEFILRLPLRRQTAAKG